ncbi:MarR family winged helix-turn-helix transcriptional regulator [Fundidesulfovibrio agrisoli]|uniref:MarR family winged helix-turn-helix transcriptional regulator n=1 Tax=Fundidesulfovibrio agrisoli TaxID=2922717 RepID=UPI001FABD89B|nr:MarR family winged helix-turn-helix transcriptional regulator [Fundidesulfovibrio agrisoli]
MNQHITPHNGPAPGELGRACACYNMRRASRALTRLYDAWLAPSGLKATQFSLLAAARSQGELTVSRLAEIMATERTTLTRNLKLLEERGLVSTAPGRDKREHLVRITKAGQAALLAALPYWEKAQTAMEERFGKERLAEFITGLRELTEAAGEAPAQPEEDA